MFGEFVFATWRPSDDELGGESIGSVELPSGTYEIDLRILPGTPNFEWKKNVTIELDSRDIRVESVSVRTTAVRTLLPDGKIGTVRLHIGNLKTVPAAGKPQIAIAGVTVAAIVGAVAGVAGLTLIGKLLVVEVRKLVSVLPLALSEPATKALAAAAVLVTVAILVRSLKGG